MHSMYVFVYSFCLIMLALRSVSSTLCPLYYLLPTLIQFATDFNKS